ncbi:MAG: hypothetical protein SFU86_12820 [Pirellulaceae bacterium]|nr:hypothetical protein [Pirellulaceae bacterium]
MKGWAWGLAGTWGVAVGTLLATCCAADEGTKGFDVVVLPLANDWQAIRYHTATGESWYAAQGNWRPIPEVDAKPPAGSYKVLLAPQGENHWFALRLEQKSGRSWRLGALKWIEMQVLPEEKPAPAPPIVGTPAN